jgi:hypothetical protein
MAWEPDVGLIEAPIGAIPGRFRYPGELYEPESAEAQEGLKKAEAAVGKIERRLRLAQDGASL